MKIYFVPIRQVIFESPVRIIPGISEVVKKWNYRAE